MSLLKKREEADFVRERERMVRNQLVNRGITDEAVLETVKRVPRDRFVAQEMVERYNGVLGVSDDGLVSADIVKDPYRQYSYGSAFGCRPDSDWRD